MQSVIIMPDIIWVPSEISTRDLKTMNFSDTVQVSQNLKNSCKPVAIFKPLPKKIGKGPKMNG